MTVTQFELGPVTKRQVKKLKGDKHVSSIDDMKRGQYYLMHDYVMSYDMSVQSNVWKIVRVTSARGTGNDRVVHMVDREGAPSFRYGYRDSYFLA